MKSKQETFTSLMNSFTYRYNLRPVFDDFLTMSLCAASQIPGAGKSYYEDQYLAAIAKYANDDLRHIFPKLFAQLICEMEDRYKDSQGNDVLGEYYEQNFCRRNSGQFFTPMHICHFMARSICGDKEHLKETRRVLDPACGSGRMLVAGAQCMGKQHEFYGIDIDLTCVKMTALNLFLNGIFHSEVMCGDGLNPDDFRISYRISLLPFGIFQTTDKEQSRLWHIHKNSFPQKQQKTKPNLLLPSETGERSDNGSQLKLF